MSFARHPRRSLLANESTVTDLLIMAVLWALAVVLVNPVGNFPLNDDWAYATNVKRFLEEGRLITIEWIAPPVFGHAFYGGLFCFLFGLSFTVLRFSTIVAGLFGMWGTYLLSRELGSGRWFAVTAALVLAFNPLYFSLSNTFMTDVPFTALSVWAILFLTRNLLHGTDKDLILGTCFTVVAILYRQIGFLIPVAYTLATMLKYPVDRKGLLKAGCLVIMGCVLLIGMKVFLNLTAPHNLRWEESLAPLQNPGRVLELIVRTAYVASLYFGLFLFPVAIQLSRFTDGTRIWRNGLVFLFIFVLSAPLIYLGRMMPLSQNIVGSILTHSGLGPVLLRDICVLHLPHLPLLPSWLLVLMTLMSLLGAAILLSHLVSAAGHLYGDMRSGVKSFGQGGQRIAGIFLLSIAILYMLPTALLTPFIDRYILPSLPLICAAIVLYASRLPASKRTTVVPCAMLSLMLLLGLSLAGTRDYLAWNRVRWAAVDELMNRKNVSPAEIDGGFEFNGLYLYDHRYQPGSSKSPYWVHDDAYVVTMGELPGYDIVRSYPFSRLIPPREGHIFVLQRQERPLNWPGAGSASDYPQRQ